MSYFTACPDCGAALDPGERCDCLLLSARNIKRVEDVLDEDLGLLPCYELTEPSVEEWNRSALETNRIAFEHEHGHPAASDAEVWEFVYRIAYGNNWEIELARHYEALEQWQKAAG